MSAAVLCIGTELTRGEIVNSNATWLCERLTARGLTVRECAEVADDADHIVEALLRLAAQCDLIVCTGGLGPTTDDITAACVARALGVRLLRDEAGLQALRERITKLGRTFFESNSKQLDFPEGATVLPNTEGTAPGFAVRIGKARAYFMPGVPREMKPMFERHVEPELGAAVHGGQHQIRLHTFGLPEAQVGELLAGVEETHGVIVGYRAHFPQIEVKLLAHAATQAEAEARSERAAVDVRQRLAHVLFAEGGVTLAQSVGQLLQQRGLKLGLAESCTGGLIGDLVCEHPASAYFLGGIVCYDNSIKTGVLGVDPAVLAEQGAVSPQVASQMAQGARRVLGADVALAVTGIAGPSGGSAEKPVGLVHYAVATAQRVTLRHTSMPRSRDQIRLHAAHTGLMLVRRVLLGQFDSS